jgi:tRNA(fMet)-specific endonuclease VapC
VLLIDEPAAEQFGRCKALLRRVGRPIGDIDLCIAGVAVRYGLTVVTNNTDHFARITDLPLEHWLELPQQSS